MAKTKKDCLAKARKDLHAPPPADPPTSRHRSKKPAAPPSAPAAVAAPAAVEVKTEPAPAEPADPTAPPFEISWENIGLLMRHYNITEKDASKLLLELVGPDAKGKSFWARYAERIKEDAAKMYADMEADPNYWKKRRLALDAQREGSTEPAPASAVPDKPPTVPEKPPAPAVPEAPPTDDEGMDDLFGEGEEEEPLDGDPLDEGEEVMYEAKGGGGDDQDSPASGACAEPTAAEEVVCESQPEEPVEPVRMPVNEDAVAALAALKPATSEPAALATIPTPSRTNKKKPASPAGSNDEFKSLLSLSL